MEGDNAMGTTIALAEACREARGSKEVGDRNSQRDSKGGSGREKAGTEKRKLTGSRSGYYTAK